MPQFRYLQVVNKGVNFGLDAITKTAIRALLVATGMTPDSEKYYVADLPDIAMTVGDTDVDKIQRRIDLPQNYHPISGAITKPVGVLPIQTDVAPNGNYIVTSNLLSASTTTIMDKRTGEPEVVAWDAGCHGVRFCAKGDKGY